MKRVALIHTVKPVLNTFSSQLKELLNEEIIVNDLYDDFLASSPAELGYFSKENKQRLYNDISNCVLAKADLIAVTCSTLTPIVEEIRGFFDVPIVSIDDAMCKRAVEIGKRIRVLATAESTIKPTVSKLEKEAFKIGKKIEILATSDEISYNAMKEGALELHDVRLLEQIKETKDFDVIVLAQASMAHLAELSKSVTDLEVLGSRQMCQIQIVKLLKEL